MSEPDEIADPDVGPDRYYKTIGDKKASFSEKDEIGPAWSDPWGCCLGQCDTWFSYEFREYHGLQEAHRLERLESKRAILEHKAKYERGGKPRLYGDSGLRAFLYPNLTKHNVPRRLRWMFREGPARMRRT